MSVVHEGNRTAAAWGLGPVTTPVVQMEPMLRLYRPVFDADGYIAMMTATWDLKDKLGDGADDLDEILTRHGY